MTPPSYTCPVCGMTEIVRLNDDGFYFPPQARRELDRRHKLAPCPGRRNGFEYHSGFAVTQTEREATP